MNEHRNLLITVVISIFILVGFQYFFPNRKPSPDQPTTATEQAATPEAPAIQNQDTLPIQGPRVALATPSLHGSVNTVGGRLDDLTLVKYRETLDPQSPEIRLLSPAGKDAPYYVDSGWTSPDPTIVLPGKNTVWQTDRKLLLLRPGVPVTLTWDNGQGLVFERQITVDENYLFTVTQTVRNMSGRPVSLALYGQIVRQGEPKTAGYAILHEGPLGVLNGQLEEYSYKDLAKENERIEQKTTGGWVGITDKYWLVALIPQQTAPVTARINHAGDPDTGRYLVNMVEDTTTLAPGGTLQSTLRVFAGAKQVRLIADYGKALGVEKFDLAIDFGWFYFLTKPFFYALDYLARWLGSFGLAILAFTVILRLALFPVANKSFVSMSKMKKLQPEIARIREQAGNDRAKMSQEMMALYKKEKVNPMGGCLPILIQIPVFFALYKVLFVALEMRHAPFYGWIQDLSAKDPTTVFNLFGLIPWTPPGFLMIGAWPILMGITMYIQQKLNPPPADPMQARMFLLLPFIMTFVLAGFPAGLVIYWTWSNALAIVQQWVINSRMNKA